MKLRNKKTGEIATLTLSTNGEDMIIMGNDMYAHITKLSELKDYEDYEEQKEYWIIYGDRVLKNELDDVPADRYKEIGNYFDTREEAEKAVEKLKAFKRLKDKGFRFTGIAGISNNIFVSFESDGKYNAGHIMYDKYSNTDNKLREYNEDLMLLFGGEE